MRGHWISTVCDDWTKRNAILRHACTFPTLFQLVCLELRAQYLHDPWSWIISLRNLWRLKAPEVPLSEAKWFKFMHGHRYLKLVLRLKKYFCLEICLSNIKNCSLCFYLFSSSYNRYHRPLLKIWFQFFVSSIKRNWALEHNPNNYVETKKPALELVKCYLKWRRASFLGSITHSRPQLVSHSFDVLVALKVHFKYGDESNLVCPCNVRAPNFS